MATQTKVKTRFLILSDTHGMTLADFKLPKADVAIHCGDLTDGSKLEEFRTALCLLKEIDAPLKLVIAGNHDFTLDAPVFQQKVDDLTRFVDVDPDLVNKEYGDHSQVRQLFEEQAEASGIVLLDEGIHHFILDNRASLTVYASPWTPSLGGDWGFQYHPEQGHNFVIDEAVDIIMTHGPPRGIMDYTDSRQRAGCSSLFGTVVHARPQLHCFGHIHEGWGAKLITWRDEVSESPSHFADIDNERSVLVEKLSGLKKLQLDTTHQWCYSTSHCSGDENPIDHGQQTLFVNASIMGNDEDYPVQLPWLVEIELRKAAEFL